MGAAPEGKVVGVGVTGMAIPESYIATLERLAKAMNPYAALFQALEYGRPVAAEPKVRFRSPSDFHHRIRRFSAIQAREVAETGRKRNGGFRMSEEPKLTFIVTLSPGVAAALGL